MMLMLTCPQIIVIAKLIADLDEWFWSYIESDFFIMFSVASKMLLLLLLLCDFPIRCLRKRSLPFNLLCCWASLVFWVCEDLCCPLGHFFLCRCVWIINYGNFHILRQGIPSKLGSWFFLRKKKENLMD
jgi:hypothetical protein